MNEYQLKIERMQAQLDGQDATIREQEQRIKGMESLVVVLKRQVLEDKAAEIDFIVKLEELIKEELKRIGG